MATCMKCGEYKQDGAIGMSCHAVNFGARCGGLIAASPVAQKPSYDNLWARGDVASRYAKTTATHPAVFHSKDGLSAFAQYASCKYAVRRCQDGGERVYELQGEENGRLVFYEKSDNQPPASDTDLLRDVVRQRDELMRERDDWRKRAERAEHDNKYARSASVDWEQTAYRHRNERDEALQDLAVAKRELERMKKKR